MRSAVIVMLMYAVLGGAQLTQLLVASMVRTLDVIAMAVSDDGSSPLAEYVDDDGVGSPLVMTEEDMVHEEDRLPNPSGPLWSEHRQHFDCQWNRAADGWRRSITRPPSV
jgi:hypothetical protein